MTYTDNTQAQLSDVADTGTEPERDPDLRAKGVTSMVSRPDGKTGHVLLVDWDGWNYSKSDTILDTMQDLPGISIIAESSPGSYHLWNLTVRDIDETALWLLELKSDPMRTMMGYTWHPPRWVTRISPKVDENGQVESPEPTFVDLQINATGKDQSRPHWEVAKNHITGFPQDLPDGVEEATPWAGDSTTVEDYQTLTGDK